MHALSPKMLKSLKPESYLSLTDNFHQISLSMSYVSGINYLKAIMGGNTRCYKLFRVLSTGSSFFAAQSFYASFFLQAAPVLGLMLRLVSKFTFSRLKVA